MSVCVFVCVSLSSRLTTAHDMQDDAVIVQEPVDLLLTCVRQVLLLAQPRDRQVPDSIAGMADGDTTPSILRPAVGASQEASPDQVSHNLYVNVSHTSYLCTSHKLYVYIRYKLYVYMRPPLLQYTNLPVNEPTLCSSRYSVHQPIP